jgi:anti-sigma factor RsiW
MTGLRCDDFVELVTAYLDGALEPQTERRFVEHLAECDGCDRYLEQFRATVRRLGALPGESLTGETRDRLMHTFKNWPYR